MNSRSPLTAISPVDGRYHKATEPLESIASEYGLIRYRVLVECRYLKALAATVPKVGILSAEEEKLLEKLGTITLEDAALVKRIEEEGTPEHPATRHDVKAVEYYLRDRMKGTTLGERSEWVHFGLTSEDVNNLSYALMLRDASRVLLASLDTIRTELETIAHAHAATPMLARTHGQPASPTTFGKEVRVFLERLSREREKLGEYSILAKLNGATGNYNALIAAFPDTDWPAFSRSFVESLNDAAGPALAANLYTAQIEPHDTYAELFQIISRINTILIDFNQDVWRYISDGWIVQKPKAGEIGSSTMPHKVNPIKFENSEGNLGVANALFEHFARKLPISRLQRDLSDSTVARVFGTAFAHTLIGYDSLVGGLERIEANTEVMREALNAHPEVLAEAIQIILRREGVEGAYEQLKDLTRGRTITMKDISTFIDGLTASDELKKELHALTPENYIGIAEHLAAKKK